MKNLFWDIFRMKTDVQYFPEIFFSTTQTKLGFPPSSYSENA
ncbi:hypothetical protein [Chryseobacterium candidae]|nr:hypothetical protein [Chryseobacterium candidae]